MTVWHQGQVSRIDRCKLLKQHPVTIWLTGLSASGKSTLAFALERELINLGRACYVLDGDNIRHGLNQNLGFSNEDRTENIRRIAEVAKLMNDAGLIVIAAFISPYSADREYALEIIGTEFFRLVHVSTSLSICESRDPKGLYKKAREGQVQDFTGVSARYDIPVLPNLVIDTATISMKEAVTKLLSLTLTNNIQSI